MHIIAYRASILINRRLQAIEYVNFCMVQFLNINDVYINVKKFKFENTSL